MHVFVEHQRIRRHGSQCLEEAEPDQSFVLLGGRGSTPPIAAVESVASSDPGGRRPEMVDRCGHKVDEALHAR